MLTIKELKILKSLICPITTFPRYETTIIYKSTILHNFTSISLDNAIEIANFLLKIPTRNKSIIYYVKNEYDKQIKKIILSKNISKKSKTTKLNHN